MSAKKILVGFGLGDMTNDTWAVFYVVGCFRGLVFGLGKSIRYFAQAAVLFHQELEGTPI